jgi:hypothetical protein
MHARGTTELLTRHDLTCELLDRLRAGHVRERVLRHDDVVEEPERERGPRDARTGHCRDRRHPAGQRHERTRKAAPRVQRGDTFT